MKMITLRLPESLVAAIDERCGSRGRSAYIRGVLEQETSGRAAEELDVKVQSRRSGHNDKLPAQGHVEALLRAGPKTLPALVRMTGKSRGEVLSQLGILGAEQNGEVWVI